MRYEEGYTTPISNCQKGDILIYTGNARSTNKCVYEVGKVNFSQDREPPSLELKRLPEEIGSKPWVVRSKVIKFMKLDNFTTEELKELLSKEAFEAVMPKADFEVNRVNHSNNFNVGWVTEYTTTGENKMNAKDKMIESNKTALQLAGLVTAGNVLNKTMLNKLRPQLPMLVRGYSDHVLAEVALANIVSFAVQNFAADNTKAKVASEAMLAAAMANFMASFNIEDIIAEVLSEVNLPEA